MRPHHAADAVFGAILGASLLVTTRASAQDLTPPPPMATPPADSSAPPGQQAESTKLDEDKKKDSGRGLEFLYLDAHGGFSYVDMASFSATTLGPIPTSSSGPAFGVGAGIRLFILTLGARATLSDLSSFSLWQVDGEVGFHIPIGHFEPYFGLHGGYAFSGTLNPDALSSAAAGSPNVAIHGGDAGLQLGMDYYFNHFISLGLEVSGNALFLHRPPAPLPAGVTAADVALLPAQEQQIYNNSGDSVGLGVIGSLHLGLHL